MAHAEVVWFGGLGQQEQNDILTVDGERLLRNLDYCAFENSVVQRDRSNFGSRHTFLCADAVSRKELCVFEFSTPLLMSRLCARIDHLFSCWNAVVVI